MDHSNQKIFIDTNIILDVLLKRQEFFENSAKILEMCNSRNCHGYVSEHSVPTIWYVMRKNNSAEVCRSVITSIFDYIDTTSLNKEQILNALSRTDFPDFEDCLQDESALEVHADCIITRNKSDYTSSKVPAYLPEEFIAMMG
ncbi:MAG: PIN domain-containing protein [Treponema sp.]